MAARPPLAHRRCVPCSARTPRLEGPAAAEHLRGLAPGWRIERDHHLIAEFELADFADALALANRIGALAEEEGHHPEIRLSPGRLRLRIWTHAIDGLSENDFILAAKIDRLPEPREGSPPRRHPSA